jgi:outer membrane protein assembly factor BamE (lipoprotein component of BamABCDE complex)
MRQQRAIPLALSPRATEVRRHVLFVVPLLFLAAWTMGGCATRHLTGSPIKEEGISKIVAGKTTRAEILSVFGPPYRVHSMGDQEILTYFYGKQSNWSVLLYTESRQSADILNVYLNRDGIVSHYAFSEGVAIPEGHFPK